MTNEILNIILTISGAIIITLIATIGYFLRIIHSDTKKAIEEVGKNKGRIELVEQQLNNDVKRLEQTTQLELRNLADTVNKLSNSVEQLVQIQINIAKKTL
jgi:uncharacterized protein YjgD (DUF1641 family)